MARVLIETEHADVQIVYTDVADLEITVYNGDGGVVHQQVEVYVLTPMELDRRIAAVQADTLDV